MADTDKDILEEAKDAFRQAQEAETENRERGEKSLKFGRMGEQWEEEAKAARKNRPTLTINRMPSFIRQVVNDARQNKPGVKVHPVDSSGDPKTAEILDGLIRSIEVNSDAEVAYDTAIDNAASAGIGHLRVDLEYATEDSFDLDIKINRIANPFSVYGDPTSIAADSSDWRTAFVTETLTEAEFEAKYPKAEKTVGWEGKDKDDEGWTGEDGIRTAEFWRREEIEKPIALMSDGAVYDFDYLDKEIDIPGGMKARMRDVLGSEGVRIVNDRKAKFWKVTQRIITGAEVLETTDWPGKYIPIIPVYGEEVWIEGKRHLFSLIHWGMDPQRIYNYGRSASIEAVALQPKVPFVGPVGAFATDAKKWATANTDNHSYIEYDVLEGMGAASKPQREMPPQPSSGWMNEAKLASDDMKSSIGMFNASMGERSNETSGKAIVSRKLEGDVSTFHFIDNLSRGIRHAGRILVDLIPKVYSKPRIVRVLGEDRKTSRMVAVGPKPKMPQDGMAPAMMPPAPMPPLAPPGTPPAMPSEPMAPPMPPVPPAADPMDAIFDLGAGKYDVTVTAGPSFTTKREESANQMIEMIRANPQLGMLIGDMVAKSLDWQGADEIGDRIKQARESAATEGKPAPAAPPVDPMAKAQMDAEAKVKAAEIGAAADVKVAEIEANTKKQRDMLEIAANKETELARIASEQEIAQQRTIATAVTAQPQPAVHPGGSVAV